MAAHKGPASSRSRCTRSGSSVAAIPVYHLPRQYLAPSVQLTIQLNIGASILLHEKLLPQKTQTLLQTRHSTTCASGSKCRNIMYTGNFQMIEDTETRYITLLVCSYKFLFLFQKNKIRSTQKCQMTMYVKYNTYMYLLYSVHILGHLMYL
jgi:hypothetical protein